MQYSRFDRHEVFEMSDTSFVLDCIQQTRDMELKNMLYGLFDGFYYYEDIDQLIHKHLPVEMHSGLEAILKKIRVWLAVSEHYNIKALC